MTTTAFHQATKGIASLLACPRHRARCAHTLVTMTFNPLLVSASNMLCDSRLTASLMDNPPTRLLPVRDAISHRKFQIPKSTPTRAVELLAQDVGSAQHNDEADAN
jgi:hypothetical protein